MSHNEQEALTAIQKTGVYQSTRHNERTKALESLMRQGYPIRYEIINKALIQFTYTLPKVN